MVFQFQYGTIGRSMAYRFTNTDKVSIPVWYDWKAISIADKTGRKQRFNSSMVRLEEMKELLYVFFYLVSIPVWYDWKYFLYDGSELVYMFQFQYGTIGCLHIHFCLCLVSDISIPVWYDWMDCTYKYIHGTIRISIPVWYDWMPGTRSPSPA